MKRLPRITVVYVIAGGPDRHKIGVSADVKERLATLSRSLKMKLRLGAIFQAPTWPAWSVESKVHSALASRRITGEWFAVTENEATAAVRNAIAALEVDPWSGRGTWTIPSASTRTRKIAVRAARKEGLTVG